MPAESQAQRAYLYARFGKAWVQRHGFNNKGKLPPRVTAQTRANAIVQRLKGT